MKQRVYFGPNWQNVKKEEDTFIPVVLQTTVVKTKTSQKKAEEYVNEHITPEIDAILGKEGEVAEHVASTDDKFENVNGELPNGVARDVEPDATLSPAEATMDKRRRKKTTEK